MRWLFSFSGYCEHKLGIEICILRTPHASLMTIRKAVYYLARAASTHLIRELRAPGDVGECSRWKGIADFDSGHGYLQKR